MGDRQRREGWRTGTRCVGTRGVLDDPCSKLVRQVAVGEIWSRLAQSTRASSTMPMSMAISIAMA